MLRSSGPYATVISDQETPKKRDRSALAFGPVESDAEIEAAPVVVRKPLSPLQIEKIEQLYRGVLSYWDAGIARAECEALIAIIDASLEDGVITNPERLLRLAIEIQEQWPLRGKALYDASCRLAGDKAAKARYAARSRAFG